MISVTNSAWPVTYNVSPGQLVNVYDEILSGSDEPVSFRASVQTYTRWVEVNGTWVSQVPPSAVDWVEFLTPETFSLPECVDGQMYPVNDPRYPDEHNWYCSEPSQYLTATFRVPNVPADTYYVVIGAQTVPDDGSGVHVGASVGMTFKLVVS